MPKIELDLFLCTSNGHNYVISLNRFQEEGVNFIAGSRKFLKHMVYVVLLC